MTESHKQIILLAALSLVSFVFWLSISTFLPVLSWSSSSLLWSTLISGVLLVILWGLSVLLIDNSMMLIFGAALMSYAGTVWFLDPLFIVAASLLFIFSVVGYYRARFALQGTIGGSMLHPLRKSVPLMVTFLLVLFSVAYYIRQTTVELQLETFIPEQYFTQFAEYTKPAIQQIDPNFQINLTIGDYIANEAKKEYPTATREEVAVVVNESLKKYNTELGMSLKPQDPYIHLVYISGMRVIKKQVEAYKEYFPKAYAVILFFTLRVLAFPLYWLAMLIVIFILRTLHRLGIVEMRAIPATILAYSFSSGSSKTTTTNI